MRNVGLLRRAIVPLLVMVTILVPFFYFGDQIESWTAAFIAGADDAALALLSIALLAGDLVLPVPSSLVSLATGAALSMWQATAVIWTGMTLGCLIGWAVGSGLLAPLDRAVGVTEQPPQGWGVWGLVLCRPLPVLAEMSVLVAAARGMRLKVLLLACGLANLPIALIYAYFGSSYLGDVPLAYLFGVVVLVCAVGLLLRRQRNSTG